MALLNNADAIYFGDRPVDRVYLGTQRVWPWTPELLFQNGEQGALYYLTEDFAGLYQDAAGTTPVTAVGQPVGLMLDRRFGLERGPELVPPVSEWVTTGTAQIIGEEGVLIDAGSLDRVQIPVGTNPDGSGLYEVWADFVTTAGILTMRGRFGTTPFPSGGGIWGVANTVQTMWFTGHATQATTSTIRAVSVREVPGHHARQPTTTARPTLRSGPLRIDYDGVDDYLRTVFPALGSNVTIARSIPGVGAQILTGQTIAAGNWDDNVDSCATLVIDRALTGPETALVTAFLNQQAGV